MSTVLEDTDGCANQYRCNFYLMAMLSPLYGVITLCAMNAPGHGNDVAGGHNATDKQYLK